MRCIMHLVLRYVNHIVQFNSDVHGKGLWQQKDASHTKPIIGTI